MDLIIHVGLPKTGTTTLQEHLLVRHPGYLGISKGNSTLMRFAVGTVSRFDFSSKRSLDRATRKFVDDVLSTNVSDSCVLSHESISQWRSVDSRLDVRPVGPKPKWTMARKRPAPFVSYIHEFLKPAWESYGQVKIVLTLRNQPDWLASLYSHRSPERRNASQTDFENQVLEILQRADPGIDFGGLVEDCEWAVGADGVTVLLCEMMDSSNYWDIASRAFGHQFLSKEDLQGSDTPRENVRRTDKDRWPILKSRIGLPSSGLSRLLPNEVVGRRLVVGGTRRVLDPAFSFLSNYFLESCRGAEIRMTDELRSCIREHCAISNRVLAAKLDRNIEQFGY